MKPYQAENGETTPRKVFPKPVFVSMCDDEAAHDKKHVDRQSRVWRADLTEQRGNMQQYDCDRRDAPHPVERAVNAALRSDHFRIRHAKRRHSSRRVSNGEKIDEPSISK